jgi:Fructose-2,6-bisphosphatase
MATLVLVRHGETLWNREERVQGWAPVGLTETGEQQAAALADALAEGYTVDRVVSSDLRRTLETARPIGRAVDAVPERDPRWRERDFGVLQGLDYRELFLGYPEFTLTEVGYTAATATPMGGESLVDNRKRVIEAITKLVDDVGSDDTVVVVTHGGPLYLVLGWIKRFDIVTTIMDQEQGNCGINELAVDPANGPIDIERENDTRHLDAESGQ